MHRSHALHRFVVGLLTLGACWHFGSRAYADLTAPPETFVDVTAAPKRAAPAPRHDKAGDQLVARDMFCSDCAPAVATTETAGFTTDAVLIATLVGEDSRAIVHVPASEVQGSWAIGETIPGVGTISDIRYTYIDFVGGGRLSLKQQQQQAKPSDAPTVPAAADAFSDRIHKLADNSYSVDRSLVRDLVSGAAGGAGGIRAQPLLDKDGGIKGVRILGARRDSVAAAIGLHSGDVLVGVDGEPIKSAQQMLNLYAKLDQKDLVTLSGTRGGKEFSIDLHLR